ncbi:hypothetical protein P7K49_027740, partial [Saguinus oedipus]
MNIPGTHGHGNACTSLCSMAPGSGGNVASLSLLVANAHGQLLVFLVRHGPQSPRQT